MLQFNNLSRSLMVLVASLGIACVGTAGEAPSTDESAEQATTATTAELTNEETTGDDEIGQNSEALGCGATTWVQGQYYNAGAVVYYSGNYYVADYANPGYSPTISTWYWSPKSGCTTTTSTTSTSTCSSTSWVQGQWYDAGKIVSYSGKYYIANYGNPGYNPTISTWYWSPKTCSTTSTSSTSTSTSTGTSAFEQIVSRTKFNEMFPDRNSFYTYDGLVKAAKVYPGFASTGTTTTKKREVAAFLANVTHETGALVYIEQIVKDDYCGSSSTCPCASGQRYYGRGPLQISWNYNYCSASRALFGNSETLRLDPGRVARESWVAWGTGLWFWMNSRGAGTMTAHNAMVNSEGFGETIRTINGAQECNGGYPAGISSRVSAYKRICGILGVTPGYNLTC